MRILLGSLLSLTLLFATPLPAAQDEGPGYPDQPDYETIHADLDQARAQARADGTLLMVVLGADWCHDSRAFLEHLEAPTLAALVDDRYTVQLVDVGYYDHVRGVVERWDLPIIYGTPTVLVIEPNSDTVLNQDSLSHWRNAASLTAEEGVRYFADYAPGPVPSAASRPAPLVAALADIDRFEREQAERIYLAYAELGTLMRNQGDAPFGQEFLDKWDNLADVRSQITNDLAVLRATAQAQAETGASDISLTWPHYELFVD